jgi:hypothetical protein
VAFASAIVMGCTPASRPQKLMFSRPRMIDGLEKLRLAFEAKGHAVTKSLRPPVPEQELRKRCEWFPQPLPEELVALYSWREGQPDGPWEESYPFWFRDCGFSALATAERSYGRIMATYGAEGPDEELLKGAFPFAEFNGGWLVLPTARAGFKDLARPVVSVHQGVDVWFHSMNTMVDTCVEWVSHPAWTSEGLYPQSLEMEIWRKHNPGIFESGT